MYFYIGIFAILIIGLFVTVLLILRHMEQKGLVTRALNMSLFLVTLPKESKDEDDSQKDEKDKIAKMEQFLSYFTNLKAGWWKRLIYGVPYVALEMAVHHKGEDIHTYIAVPRAFASVLEKQVHSFFPYAEVENIRDYNIFNPNGETAASVLKLEGSSVLPLITYRDLSVDPLNNIANAMSKIQTEGEGVAVQIITSPTNPQVQRQMAEKVIKEIQQGKTVQQALSKPIHDETRKQLTTLIKGPDQDGAENNMPKGPVDDAAIKDIQEKIAKHHFSTNIRLVASADTKIRAEQILSELEAAFVQFNATNGNSIKSKRVSSRKMRKFIFNYSFRVPNARDASVFSIEEISSFYHFPTSSTKAHKMKTLRHKAVEPPVNLSSRGIILGENNYRGKTTQVRISKEDRRRHMYLIGQTGTGKSSLMKNMIEQDILNGEGLAIIDPHGDLAEAALKAVPPERKNDVVFFDPGDVSKEFGLNMLEFNSSKPEQKTLVVNELLGIFKKLFSEETMGPVFDQYFRNATLLLLDDYEYEIPTILDIPRVLTDASYRSDKLSREKNPIVKRFWEEEAEKAGGDAALSNIAPYITSKINGLIADEFIRPIVSKKKSSINFRDAMDNNKIIIANLSKGKLGDLNANLLGLIIVGKLLIAALSRVDSSEETRDDFFLYMDEFQNFSTNTIASILSEARKYRLNLTVAHQFIKQLEDSIRDAVFGNVGSMIAFRVGADDAEYLENQFSPEFTESDLINIDNFNAHVKLLVDNQTSKPFTMRTLPPSN
ncbi:MAG: type IV secretion system DNA-binding domain-containing protein [Candidatus Spechtbacterales bacterium]|nr:type IV secretion system DNA-binding domain-containing protein [Candidatus Spechtbacterales bacterium]